MKLYFGDIHNHCGITYGFGSLENALSGAREHLDFCAVTGHAFWPDMPPRDEYTAFLIDFHKKGFQKLADHYDEIKKQVLSFNREGEFTTFYSYEMHSSTFGDHHVVSGDDKLPLVYANSPEDWWNSLRAFGDTIIIPHHIAYAPNYRGISWADFNDKICPVVEVTSKHGLAMSDRHPNNYYHNMGARDGRNTVYRGLLEGKIFGFVGSTDHHAGYPGSYGDSYLAALANSNSRHDIMEAIKARRTYALTADRILCDLSVNGNVFGSAIPNDGQKKTIKYSVTASDFIDKITLCKNTKPILIINGETLPEKRGKREYKVRFEFGWGNNVDLFDWNFDITLCGGEFTDLEKCFRGRSVLAPSPDLNADDVINKIDNRATMTKTEVQGKVQTVKNVTTTSPSTSAIVVTISGDESTVLTVTVNGKTVKHTLSELLDTSFTYPTRNTNSQTFKIHAAVPDSAYKCAGEFVCDDTEPAFYHMEVRECNGSMAFVSPIFFS